MNSSEETTEKLLSGWRLYAMWGLIAAIISVGIFNSARGVLPTFRLLTVAAPTFEALGMIKSYLPIYPTSFFEGSVGDRAGLPKGQIVRINGEDINDETPYFKIVDLLRGPYGATVDITMVTAQQDTVAATVVRSSDRVQHFFSVPISRSATGWYHHVVLFITSFSFLVAALMLLLRKPRSRLALIGAAALLAQGFLLLFMTGLVARLGTMPFGYELYNPIIYIGMTIFVIFFPTGRPASKWGYAIIGLAVGMSVASLLGASASLFVPLYVLTIVAAIVYTRWRYKSVSTPIQKQQTRWILWAIIFAGSAMVLQRILVTAVPYTAGSTLAITQLFVSGLLNLAWTAFPLAIVISLLKYRLWDVEAAWSRSAVTAGLTLLLTAVIAGGTAVFRSLFGASGPYALGIASTVAAVLLIPLQQRLTTWSERRFMHKLNELKAGLPVLINHLRETASATDLATAVIKRVGPAVHASFLAVVVPSADGWQVLASKKVDDSRVVAWADQVGLATPPELTATRRKPWRSSVWRMSKDPYFPVRVALKSEKPDGEVALQGWLLVGARPDGSGYGLDDLEALASVAACIGRALQVVRYRRVEAEALAGAFSDLHAAIQLLRQELRAHAPS